MTDIIKNLIELFLKIIVSENLNYKTFEKADIESFLEIIKSIN